jgi:hypothetical protein
MEDLLTQYIYCCSFLLLWFGFNQTNINQRTVDLYVSYVLLKSKHKSENEQ